MRLRGKKIKLGVKLLSSFIAKLNPRPTHIVFGVRWSVPAVRDAKMILDYLQTVGGKDFGCNMSRRRLDNVIPSSMISPRNCTPVNIIFFSKLHSRRRPISQEIYKGRE